MKIDAGIPTNDPRESGKAAKVLEDAGYDGAFTAETSHDPFLPLVTAAIPPFEYAEGESVDLIADGLETMIRLGWKEGKKIIELWQDGGAETLEED